MANTILKELLNFIEYFILFQLKKNHHFFPKKKTPILTPFFGPKISHEGDVFKPSILAVFLRKLHNLVFHGKKEFERIIQFH